MRRRILSIDGGGIKGVFPASFLAQLEETLAINSAGKYFDLIAGTSVGGIIALGLGLGLTAREMEDFFVKHGRSIFPDAIMPTGLFRLFLGRSKYTSSSLQAVLRQAFGNRTLGDSRVRLLIPSFDAGRADIHIYKTAHSPRLRVDYRLSAVEVAMATAAAPSFFPGYDSKHHITLIDGGVWANNPTALAVVEGITVLGWKSDEIDVLSIGCTEEVVDFRERGHTAMFWLRRAIDAAMRGQSRSALGMAQHLTGRDAGTNNVIRVNPSVERGAYSLDGVAGLSSLQGFAYAQARHSLPEIMNRFFQSEAEPFIGQPVPGSLPSIASSPADQGRGS